MKKNKNIRNTYRMEVQKNNTNENSRQATDTICITKLMVSTD